jgi:ATP/maltotriose-dependent transcriptional regulator MalT
MTTLMKQTRRYQVAFVDDASVRNTTANPLDSAGFRAATFVSAGAPLKSLARAGVSTLVADVRAEQPIKRHGGVTLLPSGLCYQPEPLSGRECAILNLIAQGCINKQVARVLFISPETVKSHLKNIFVKLNVQTRAQAVSRAHGLGFIGAS